MQFFSVRLSWPVVRFLSTPFQSTSTIWWRRQRSAAALARKRYEYCSNACVQNTNFYARRQQNSVVRRWTNGGMKKLWSSAFRSRNAKRNMDARTCAWLCWNILIVLLFIIEWKLTVAMCVSPGSLSLFLLVTPKRLTRHAVKSQAAWIRNVMSYAAF